MSTLRLNNPKITEPKDTFIILAAGIGRRMKSHLPKILLEINGQRLIDWQLSAIRRYSSNADIIIVGGFRFASILSSIKSERIVENPFYETTNICESLRIGINSSTPSNLFIIHGDIFFDKESLKFNKDNGGILVDKTGSIDSKKVGVAHQYGRVKNLSYGLPDKWCQIAYIPYQYFDLARTKINTINKNCTTYEYINILLEYFEFEVLENKKRIIEIDSSKDLV